MPVRDINNVRIKFNPQTKYFDIGVFQNTGYSIITQLPDSRTIGYHIAMSVIKWVEHGQLPRLDLKTRQALSKTWGTVAQKAYDNPGVCV